MYFFVYMNSFIQLNTNLSLFQCDCKMKIKGNYTKRIYIAECI